jgi:hypothetical protein
MKGFAGIAAAMLALTVGLVGVASGAERTGHAVTAKAKKKKCKAHWVFKKGKCRRLKGPHYPPPDNSPRDLVRATLTWQGSANLDLIVRDEQGRIAGYSSTVGRVVNQIPDATLLGDASSGGTETFVDHLWHPNPFVAPNRGFSFTGCARNDPGPPPVSATLSLIDAFGGTRTLQLQLGRDSDETSTICLGYYA